ncbi:MAG TPA: hypothetical protein EYG97_02175 [Arcobacter sp.]|nr:hypothetical protein [Arcobacter sp.]HIP55809.1 hypothetical protein [Arcobacter sp.]
MVINISSVKTEALLLFCRDMIASYENSNEDIFSTSSELKLFIKEHIHDLKKAINVVVQPSEYYIRNIKVNRIKYIVNNYNDINKSISTHLSANPSFNPSMLCFALLATWFKELEHETTSKEFIYFGLYPYGEIYDKLIIQVTNQEYKSLNVKMIQIAEDVMLQLNRTR